MPKAAGVMKKKASRGKSAAGAAKKAVSEKATKAAAAKKGGGGKATGAGSSSGGKSKTRSTSTHKLGLSPKQVRGLSPAKRLDLDRRDFMLKKAASASAGKSTAKTKGSSTTATHDANSPLLDPADADAGATKKSMHSLGMVPAAQAQEKQKSSAKPIKPMKAKRALGQTAFEADAAKIIAKEQEEEARTLAIQQEEERQEAIKRRKIDNAHASDHRFDWDRQKLMKQMVAAGRGAGAYEAQRQKAEAAAAAAASNPASSSASSAADPAPAAAENDDERPKSSEESADNGARPKARGILGVRKTILDTKSQREAGEDAEAQAERKKKKLGRQESRVRFGSPEVKEFKPIAHWGHSGRFFRAHL